MFSEYVGSWAARAGQPRRDSAMAIGTTYSYRLSRTVLRVTTHTFDVVDRLADSPSGRQVQAIFEIATVAEKVDQTIEIGDQLSTSTKTKLTFTADRRLASIESSSTGQGPAWLKAGAGLVSTIVGSALSLVSPASSLAPAAMVRAMREVAPGDVADRPGDNPRPPTVADREQRVFALYRSAHPAEADALIAYREAIPRMMKDHAVAARADDLARLKELSGALSDTRAQAAVVIAHLANWQHDQVQRTLIDVAQEDLGLEEVPPASEVRELLRREDGDSGYRRWRELARLTGVALSVDRLDKPVAAALTTGDNEDDDIVVRYALGCTARITTWAATADGEDWHATPTSMQTQRVVDWTEEDPVEIRLGRAAWKDGSIRLVFNDVGEPSEVGGDSASVAAGGLGELPGTLKDALEGGVSIAKALVPGGAIADRLDRDVSIAEQKKKLSDLLGGGTPTAAEQELKALQDAVKAAELRARLAMAEALSRSGSSAAIVYGISTSS